MPDFSGVDFYNIDQLLAPTDLQVRDSVREWVSRRFLPIVARHYAAGTFPMELVPEMAQLNCFGANIRGYGCPGLSNLAYGLIMQELERGDSGLRTFASVHGALAMNAIHMFGSEAQKTRWLAPMARGEKLGCFALTEPDFGSNPAGMLSTARQTADGFVLNGSKMWIGNGNVADVAVVWAKVDGVIRGLLVEKGTPGFRAELIEGKLSLRAAETCRLTFANCPLAADAMLPHSGGLKSPLTCLNHARYGIAWGAVGSAMACFEEAREFAARRVQFGKPIASFQLTQRKLAIMLTELTKAQLLNLRLAQLKDAGKETPQQISLAKRNNVAMAIEVARTARDILGGVGILDQFQGFRHMCNLESVKTYEGTDDMHLLILGQEITGIPAFS
ncbi:MAG: acyl-CoA dehydrogenase family protein [Tepidisphaeraceae bacterium]